MRLLCFGMLFVVLTQLRNHSDRDIQRGAPVYHMDLNDEIQQQEGLRSRDDYNTVAFGTLEV